MTADQGSGDDDGHMPSMSSKTRELGKLQDMYRRTLAASWAAQEGELPADQCIENIFAGGDGWAQGTHHQGIHSPKPSSGSTNSNDSETDRRTLKAHRRVTSTGYSQKPKSTSKAHFHSSSRSNKISDNSGVSGRTSIQQQVQSNAAETPIHNWRRADDVDEFTAREDLRSWEISTPLEDK